MTPREIRNDNLTRWNRAGLQRFRYVNGNAVTFLETIRQQLADSFPAWEKVQGDVAADETPPERQVRIVKQYTAPRREWAWEIARTFARATQILTEHVNAFANEGSILTATQWEYLRRLVVMLDYHPRPPASASTTLAITAKDDKGVGTVKVGFQVKHSPQDGSPPIVFETLDHIDVDPRLNALRLDGWNRNPESFNAFAPYDTELLWTLPEDADVSVGQPGVLVDGHGAVAVRVGGIREDRVALQLGVTEDRGRVRGDTQLLLQPDGVYLPHLNGPDVLKLTEQHGFAAGQVIGWMVGGTVGFARIVAVDRSSIQVADTGPSTDITGGGVALYATGTTGPEQFAANDNEWRFPPDVVALTIAGSRADGSFLTSFDDERDEPFKNEGHLEDVRAEAHPNRIIYKRLTWSDAHALHFFSPATDQPVARTAPPPLPRALHLDGGVGRLQSGDYLVCEDATGALEAVRVARIVRREDGFSLQLESAPTRTIRRLHGPFTLHLRPVGYDRDPTMVAAPNLYLEISGDDLPPLLTAGKAILVEPEGGADGALPFKATILSIDRHPPASVSRLVLDATPEQWHGYRRGDVIIRANAVAAGHGESKPSIALGSGDVVQTNQSFTLSKERVSFRADPLLSQGVRAAIEITVGNRRYEEVSTLADSEATDAHYTVHMTEERYVMITFGDGFHGRRLPTGRNNITVSYRVGTGSAGNNLPAGSLKEDKPHSFIEAILQPLPTSGGQEMEDVNQIRQNAPAHLRTLDRGVSLADHESLAASQPGVWHARAFLNPSGANRRDLLELAIVPANGGVLGDLKRVVEKRLVALAPPGIELRVARFDPLPLDIQITLRVDTEAFDYSTVEKAVREAVYDAFKLETRAPGRPAYRAEVYASVEAVAGVVNADVSILADAVNRILSEGGEPPRRVARGALGEIWALWPTDRQAAYVARPEDITVVRQEVIV